jgi:hypothetical protein
MRRGPAGSSPPQTKMKRKNMATGSNLICIHVDQLLRTKLIQLLAGTSQHGLLPKSGIHDSISHTWHQRRGEEQSHELVGSFCEEVNK